MWESLLRLRAFNSFQALPEAVMIPVMPCLIGSTLRFISNITARYGTATTR